MTQSKEINTYMNRLGSEAKEASMILAQASLEQKNEALSCISEQIESTRDEILSINKRDLDDEEYNKLLLAANTLLEDELISKDDYEFALSIIESRKITKFN